jgi:metal-dependent hydrolase (beta-lactamase superfamily II)
MNSAIRRLTRLYPCFGCQPERPVTLTQSLGAGPADHGRAFVAGGGKEQGVVVLTACSQAGVVNVLRHARGCFPELPLYGVMGGFHLSGTNERVIPETVDAMREFDLAVTAAAHCTGWRATGRAGKHLRRCGRAIARRELYKF